MTNLDLARVLKDELRGLAEEISRLQRRYAIFREAATKLRASYPQEVVLAEIRATGEELPLHVAEETRP